VEDQQIAGQVLEAEGVIRELAAHLQRAVEMADAAVEAKESYRKGQAGFESATSQISAGRQTLGEVAAAVKKDFAQGAHNLQSAGTALTAFADRRNKAFEDLAKEVTKLAFEAGDLRQTVLVGHEDLKTRHEQGRMESSQEATRHLARIVAVGAEVTVLTARLDSVEKSLQTSFAALESVVKREATRTEQASLEEFQELRSKMNHVLWVAGLILLATLGVVIKLYAR
jgi:hypothetical protein